MAIILLTVVPRRAVITPPTKGVQVPDNDNAASSKPNSVLDVPISRDSLLLRGPRMYVALLKILSRETCKRKDERENGLVTANAQGAGTQQSQRSNQYSLPFSFSLQRQGGLVTIVE